MIRPNANRAELEFHRHVQTFRVVSESVQEGSGAPVPVEPGVTVEGETRE